VAAYLVEVIVIMNGKTTLSRRSLLKGGAIAGGSALAGLTHLFGIPLAFAQAADDDTQTILNLAATAELFATTHYLAAINGAEDLGLDEIQVNYLKAGFLAEQDHLELLMSLGGAPVVNEFYVPETLFSDKELFSTITEVAETTFVGAYLAAARIFSNAGAQAFAVTAAQIAAVEAEHRALVRQIGGRLANNTSYAQYNLLNVSSAVPVLQPFLDGSGEGFVGPVSPPTADDIAAIRAEADAIGYENPGVPFPATEFAAMMPSPAATADAAASADGCTVTAGGEDINIRSGAGTDMSPSGVLSAGSSSAVDGMTTGSDGQMWYRLSSGGFVRADVVSANAACSSLPSV
jgi:hypothetical protein